MAGSVGSADSAGKSLPDSRIKAFHLLSQRGEVVGELTPEAVWEIGLRPGSSAAREMLREIHRRDEWIRCPCGVTYHVRGGATLARNPNRGHAAGGCCVFCRDRPEREDRATGVDAPRPPPKERRLGLLLRSRRRGSTAGSTRESVSSYRAPGLRYAGMAATLWTAMSDVGLLSPDGPVASNTLWRNIRTALDGYPVDPDAEGSLTLADLTWLPTGRCTMEALLTRVEAEWSDTAMLPEVWAIGLVDEIPPSRGGRLRFVLDGVGDSEQIDLPAHAVSRIGRAGPYLVLVVAARGRSGPVEHFRMVAQAVASADVPAPVEPAYEREVALLLVEMKTRS
jgi:hypothetical protein